MEHFFLDSSDRLEIQRYIARMADGQLAIDQKLNSNLHLMTGSIIHGLMSEREFLTTQIEKQERILKDGVLGW